MAKPKNTPAPFELACPCCHAVLKIDPETHAVIAFTPAVAPKTFNDIEEAARAMKEQDTRKESLFRQSVEAQKHQADLLEKKFQEALRRAKEAPDVPKIRDFDLD
jgi:ribulose kinase